ncbi:MAG: TrmB family transcriptional regulator [Halobacteriota archaeon]
MKNILNVYVPSLAHKYAMTSDDEFITNLMGFGLTEKEAQCYLYLLKFGPKTPSPLAKSLKTYREDVHRTLTMLIDKGMVRPSLDSPTMYTAVELETALDSALKQHETELREMEKRKRELEELSRQQRFRPSDEVSTFKIIKSVGELVTLTLTILASAEKGFVFVIPEDMVIISSQFGINAEAEQLLKSGKYARGITDITHRVLKSAHELVDIGEDIRHLAGYQGILFAVVDNSISVSAINVNIRRISLGEPIAMIWTDDTKYAQYLTSTFEMLWEQSIPAEERIQELLAQGPPRAD